MIRKNIEKPEQVSVRKPCGRCGGTGVYTSWHGVCYRCGGSGTDPKPAKAWAFPASWTDEECDAFVVAKAAAKAAAADRKAAKAVAAIDARKAEAEAHPTMGVILAADAEGLWVAPLAMDIIGRFVMRGYAPTSAQADVLAREAERIPSRRAKAAAEAEARAAAAPVPCGRVVLIGEVVSTKVVDSDFGSVMKMMLRGAEGWRVWVTMPSSIDAATGDRVRLTATVTASTDDPTFGFGSRPAKAEII